jgi:hypothetical protein
VSATKPQCPPSRVIVTVMFGLAAISGLRN